MPLQKQTVAMNMGKGMDNKTDPKLVVPSKYIYLQNCTFQKTGALTKRNGYELLGDIAPTGASGYGGNAITTYKDELITYNGKQLFSYSESEQLFNSKGKKVAVDLDTFSIVRTTNTQINPDSTFSSAGMSLFAWEDSTQGLSYSIFDTETGQSIITNQVISATGTKVKVHSNGVFMWMFYVDGSNLDYARFDTTSITTPPVTGTIDTLTGGFYDAQVIGTNIVILLNQSNTMSFVTIDAAGTISATITTAFTFNFGTLFGDPSNNVWIAYNPNFTNISYVVFNPTLSGTVLGATFVETVGADILNIGAVYNPVTAVADIFYEIDNSPDHYTKVFNGDILGTFSTPIELMRYVGLWAKPFVDNGDTYVVITSQSTLQSSYFVSDNGGYVIPDNGHVIAKVAHDNGGGYNSQFLLAETNDRGNGLHSFAYMIKDNLSSLGGDIYTETGISSAELTFGEGIANETIGNNLHSSGAILAMYDGQHVVEHGYNIYPEDIAITAVEGGGSLALGSYQYVAVYEWTDAQGQVHRSAPSVPETLDTTVHQNIFIDANTNTNTFSSVTPSSDVHLFKTGYRAIGPGITNPAFTLMFAPLVPAADRMQLSNTTVVNSGQYTLTPGNLIRGDTTIGTNVIDLFPQMEFYKIVTCTTGSAVLTVNNSTGIRAGMTANFSGGNRTVLSTTPTTITLTANAPQNLTNGFVRLFLTSPCDTNSNTTLTNFTNAASFQIGDRIWLAGLGTQYNLTTITNIAGTTVTISDAVGFSTSTTTYAVFDAELPAIGEVYTQNLGVTNSTPVFSGSITVVSTATGQVTVDQQALATTTTSEPYQAAANSGPSFFTDESFGASIQIPTLRVTDKEDVSIAVYRTESNGTTFYRVSSLSVPILNDKTVDSVTFIDALADGEIVGNELLYTTGGVLENIEIPATSIIGVYKSRLMGVSAENPLQLFFSKLIVSGTPAEFNDSLFIQLPETDGPITGFHQMDDKLVIFKRNTIFVVFGDGPNATGTSNDFSFPQIVSTDCGCVDKKSIVLMPYGLMFKSGKGIYLLGRNMQAEYIGDDVEGYNDFSITSATMIENLNQIRYTMDNGDTLTYDYYNKQWSVFKSVDANDSTISDNLFTYISPSGDVFRETPGQFLDNDQFIPIQLKTANFSFAQVQGFERAYKMLLLGDWKSPHSLLVNVYHDFKSVPDQATTIPVTALMEPYQQRVFFSTQKAQTFQVEIIEQQTAPFGEGLSMSGMTFEIGVKRGTNTVPAVDSYG